MTRAEKFWYLVGPTVLSFVYAVTAPVIQVYFFQLIGPRVLALASLTGTALSAAVNYSVSVQALKEWYREHFGYVVVVDVLCFFAVSFAGLEYPEARFVGLAVLNAVSTCLWVMVMRNTANRIIVDGDERTDFDALNETTCRAASFAGGVLAVVFVDLPVEACVVAQCLANLFMGVTDLYAFRRLGKAYGLVRTGDGGVH